MTEADAWRTLVALGTGGSDLNRAPRKTPRKFLRLVARLERAAPPANVLKFRKP